MDEIQKKILIIEDEAPLLHILETTLKREGFQVFTAGSGKVGLAAALRFRPHLVLLDLIMPGMNGIALLKKLRANEWGRDVPVIVLTNLSDTEAIIEAVEFDSIRIVEGEKDLKLSNVDVVRETITTYIGTRIRNGVYDFLVKKNVSLREVVERVKERLEDTWKNHHQISMSAVSV